MSALLTVMPVEPISGSNRASGAFRTLRKSSGLYARSWAIRSWNAISKVVMLRTVRSTHGRCQEDEAPQRTHPPGGPDAPLSLPTGAAAHLATTPDAGRSPGCPLRAVRFGHGNQTSTTATRARGRDAGRPCGAPAGTGHRRHRAEYAQAPANGRIW